MFKSLIRLFAKKPAVIHLTTDGGVLAPYPDMTDDELRDFEREFRISTSFPASGEVKSMTRDEEAEQFIERQRALGRFYVVQITNYFFEVELEKFLRANGYKFSVPVLPGETLEQAQKRGENPSGNERPCNCDVCAKCGAHYRQNGNTLPPSRCICGGIVKPKGKP